jgi:hypothetical protein
VEVSTQLEAPEPNQSERNGTVIISAVPEPGSLLLAGWGLLGALGAGRKILTRSWPLRRRRHVAA